jgi:hypothetical protein
VCGNGVGVLGSGTGATCGTQQSASGAGDGGGILDVSPTVQATLCGTGVGVLGTGSTANCAGSQSATGPGSGGVVDLGPGVQVGVCGNGVGVLGAGTSARCADSAGTGSPGTPGTGGNGANGGTGARGDGSAQGSVLADAVGLVSAVPGDLARGSLAFTGGNPGLTALLGIGLAGAGGLMLRLRRFGYKG